MKQSRVFDGERFIFTNYMYIKWERREFFFFCFRIPSSAAVALKLCSAFILIITPIIGVIGYFTYFKPLMISLISVQKSKMTKLLVWVVLELIPSGKIINSSLIVLKWFNSHKGERERNAIYAREVTKWLHAFHYCIRKVFIHLKERESNGWLVIPEN